MLDIVISGGTAVLPSGPAPADIGVAGERIAAIGAPGSLAALGAGRIVDAAGQIVIPGGIDPHVHCNWPMPMPGVAQPMLTEPASRVSLAALHGDPVAEHAAVVQAHFGKGDVLLFANNPVYRGETIGSYALVFNAIVNFGHLK